MLSRPMVTFLIKRMKVAQAVFNPNGNLVNCTSPLFIAKAVNGFDCSDKGICQYPLQRSISLKNLSATKFPNAPSMVGIGSASNTQKRHEPSGFITKTTGEQYGDSDGYIIPKSSILNLSIKCFLMIGNRRELHWFVSR